MPNSEPKRRAVVDGRWCFHMAMVALILMAIAPFHLSYCQWLAGEGVGTQKLLNVSRGGSSAGDSNLATSARIFHDSQWTILVIVAGLASAATWRLFPILWKVVHASLSTHLVMLGVVFLLWLVYGGLSGMGMPGLFWNASPTDEFMAALGVSLFVFWMLYLLFVSDYESHRDEPERRLWTRLAPALQEFRLPAALLGDPSTASPGAQMGWFLAYAGFPILVALALPAVLPSVRSGDLEWVVAAEWLLGLGAGVGMAALVVLTRIPTRLNELRRQIGRGRLNLEVLWTLDARRLDPEGNAKNMLTIVAFLYILAWLLPTQTRALFPPAFSLCILLGVSMTIIVWLGMKRHWRSRLIAASTVLALVAASGMLDYDVVLRDLAGKGGGPNLYPSPLEQFRYHLGGDEAKPPSYAMVKDLAKFQQDHLFRNNTKDFLDRQQVLNSWKDRMAADVPNAKPILVVVTTSGGALRAGVWTEAVLKKLDGAFPGFHRNVRLITGASGGMLGAARYVARHGEGRGLVDDDRHPDFLGPIAWQIAFHDFLPNALLPFPMPNRGDTLEDVWCDFAPELKTTFGNLAARERNGEIPSIVFSPMLVEDGRRILIANLPLDDLTVNLTDALLDGDKEVLRRKFFENQTPKPGIAPKALEEIEDYDLEYPGLSSVSAMEFSKLFGDEALNSLRLASAVRMSATFPFITSVVALPTFPARHVVDAGYYDNYGVNLASAWINSHKDWIHQHAAGVLVVQIRAFRNEKRLKILDQEVHTPSTPPASSGASVRAWLGWAVGLAPRFLDLLNEGARSVVIPAQGVAMARESSMFFRNDENLQLLHDTFTRLTGNDRFFRTVVFTCDTIQIGQASQNVETLNWYIDPVERRQIQRNMNRLDPVSQTGRDRNHLRLMQLKEWWQARGGKVAVAPDEPVGSAKADDADLATHRE
jgi:hypothetical protein